MKLYLLAGAFVVFAIPAFAQNPAQEEPAAASGPSDAGKPAEAKPDLPCADEDALCKLARSLKKKDPGIGSKDGGAGGYYTIQRMRPDYDFLQKNNMPVWKQSAL